MTDEELRRLIEERGVEAAKDALIAEGASEKLAAEAVAVALGEHRVPDDSEQVVKELAQALGCSPAAARVLLAAVLAEQNAPPGTIVTVTV